MDIFLCLSPMGKVIACFKNLNDAIYFANKTPQVYEVVEMQLHYGDVNGPQKQTPIADKG